MSARLQTAIGFLASALALAFLTLFIMIDLARPLLDGSGPADPETVRAIAEQLYPLPAVTEVRAFYLLAGLLPILLPALGDRRALAWACLLVGTLLTAGNLQDGIGAFLLGGRPLLGIAYMLAVGLPAAIGLAGAWRWARQPVAAA